MRSTFIFALLLVGCASDPHSSGAQGRAELAYVDGDAPQAIDEPIARGSKAIVRVHLSGNNTTVNPTFTSSDGNVLFIESSSRATGSSNWFVTLSGLNEGKSTLTVGDGMKAIDTFVFEVVAIKTFDAPQNVDVSVGALKIVELTPKDATGRRLHAKGVVSWGTERTDLVRFFDSVRNATMTSATGTRVQIRGLAPGMAKLQGVYEKTLLEIPVNVR